MSPEVPRPGPVLRLAEPYNAGTPLPMLGRRFLTPVGSFYVRNHGPVPQLDRAVHRIMVEGEVDRPLDLSLDELHAGFQRHEALITLQCAGNRRAELAVVAPTASPLQWAADAIGTARWSGIRLADLIRSAQPRPLARHVWFEGADEVRFDGTITPFGASIPLEIATGGDTMLATGMGGRALPHDHGGPLRAVVPGWVGARSVKWLRRITLSDRPSANPFQTLDYRIDDRPITTVALTSVITEPGDGATLRAGSRLVRGYALAAPDAHVERVLVSADGNGEVNAKLRGEGRWTWRQWTARLYLGPGRHRLAVQAWDSLGRTQPDDLAECWNAAGYMNAAVHRITVEVDRRNLDRSPDARSR